MPYLVYIKRSAEKELDRFPTEVYNRIVNRLLSLRDNPGPPRAKKLHGREGHRIRIGSYRVLYTIDESEKKVEIVSIAHRREAYR